MSVFFWVIAVVFVAALTGHVVLAVEGAVAAWRKSDLLGSVVYVIAILGLTVATLAIVSLLAAALG